MIKKWLMGIILTLVATNTAWADQFKVMTYNVLSHRYLACAGYDKMPNHIIDGQIRIRKIVDILKEQNPDLISLQEMEKETLKVLQETLSQDYHIVHSNSLKKNIDFLVILCKKSKFTVAESRIIAYPKSNKNALALKLETRDNQVFWIINTKIKWDAEHLPFQYQTGAKQIQLLARIISHEFHLPVILCGDFNVKPNSRPLKPLLSNLKDVYYPQAFPTVNIQGDLKRIDYIMHSKAFSSQANPPDSLDKTKTLPSVDHPSDHLPLTATLSL